MLNIEKIIQINLFPGKNRDKGIMNGHVDVGWGEERVGRTERVAWTHRDYLVDNR